MEPKELRADLERLRRRLRGLFALHGSLRLAAAVGAALALLYALDRSLSLPAAVRVFLLLGALAGAAWLALGGIVAPLRRRIRAEDVACAVEQRFPEFDGRLLSTLELDGEALAPDRNVSLALVELLRAETGALRRGVRFAGIFDYRGIRRLAALALALLVLDAGFGAARPQLAAIFFSRLLGGGARWPQQVFLAVEFPETAEHFTVEYDGAHPAKVRLARGASLPVTVRAVGEEPRFVELRTRDGTTFGRAPALPLAPTAGGEWVGRFRGVRESFAFHAHDGDADDDSREVAVEVFAAPAVAAVTSRLTFPEYTGLAPRSEPRGDIEAPVGTRVDLEVSVAGEVQGGSIVFDPGGREGTLAAPAQAGAAWITSFVVSESCSYSVHLLGANGFSNLDPAAYAVIAVLDRPPTVRLLEPAMANVDVTPAGALPFRVAADDDYAVASLLLAVRSLGAEEEREFVLFAPGAAGAPAPLESGRRLVYSLLDLAETAFLHADGARASQVGDTYVYRVSAEDNCAGAGGPHRAALTDRRVDVVSVNEKMRLLTERQIRHKDEVRALRELQGEKRERLLEVLADLEASEGDREPDAERLSALEIGQNQVTNRALRSCRDFADLFEEYLLNRLDHSAAAERLIPLLVEQKRASLQVDGFDFGVYRPIVDAFHAGAYGQLDVLGRLLEMLSCILDVSGDLAPRAAQALADARLASEARARPEALRAALAAEEEALARLDLLLEKLDEWEDFQEILTLFRDLVEDQRDLNARARAALRSEDGR